MVSFLQLHWNQSWAAEPAAAFDSPRAGSVVAIKHTEAWQGLLQSLFSQEVFTDAVQISSVRPRVCDPEGCGTCKSLILQKSKKIVWDAAGYGMLTSELDSRVDHKSKAVLPLGWSHELFALSLHSGWWRGFTYFFQQKINFLFKYKCCIIQFLYKVPRLPSSSREAQQPCREQLEKMQPDPAFFPAATAVTSALPAWAVKSSGWETPSNLNLIVATDDVFERGKETEGDEAAVGGQMKGW